MKYVDEFLCEKEMGQYIVTLNIDELDKENIDMFKNTNKVIAFLNRESDENRFMGMKYV